MFDKWLLGWRDRPRTHDERLSALLREWRGVEPRTGFEAAVWRRIRTASAAEQRRLAVVAVLREWFAPRPVWVSAMAAAAGIVVGVGLAFSTPAVRAGHQTDEPLLHSHTLAGSYLTMVAGGDR